MFARESGFFGCSICLRARICFLFLVVLILSGFVFGQAQDSTTLESQKTVYGDISGGHTDNFQVDLTTGQYGKIVVAQRGVDVFIRLIGSDGAPAIEVDGDPRNQGDETIEFVGSATGSYHLTVEPRFRSASPGRYEITLVEVRNATDKEKALDEARRLSTQVNRLYFANDPDKALPLAEHALEIRQKELSADHPDVGTSWFLLANVYNDKGEYDKAETYYNRAIEIRQKAFGKDHFSLAPMYNNLGILYKSQGNYVKAEQYYTRTLEIREKILDPNHPAIAGALINLGTVASARGDKVKARQYYDRVLQIREKTNGPDSPEVALALNNIANLYSDIATAEPFYQRALAIREKALGPDDPDVGQTLYNIAVLYSSNGDFARAEPFVQRSLSIFEKRLGEDHPYVSYSLNLLAVINKNLGDYAKAEALYQRAVAIKEKTQPFHPDLGLSYANLANLYTLKGEMDKAVDYQTRANRLLEYNISLNLATGSEKEKLTYLDTLATIANQTLTLNFQTVPTSVAAAELGATTVLQRKGRVLDSISESMAALRGRSSKDDQKLLDDLNETTSKLVSATLDGAGDTAPDVYKKQVSDLEQRRMDLESKISSQASGFFEQSKPVTLNDVRAALPTDAALVEFAIYRPISPKNFEFSDENTDDSKSLAPPHYAVYVINKNAEIKWKDLGEAQKIDKQIDAVRSILRDPQRKEANELLRAIDESVMRPIRSMAGSATHLFISPDGELNLMPFEALVDETNHYLVERYSFTYLTSGRDLLRMQKRTDSKELPLIVADPAFGSARAGTTPASSTRGLLSKVVTRDINDTYFAPLSGSAEEGKRIQALFPQSKLLTGAAASETAIKAAKSPQILHLATHGFFLEDREAAAKLTRSGKVNSGAAESLENPLLRS
ncbi:MAG TPA: tetratricopeptide repeat protein, partial [Pyrinomonadaceae bacterium]|nr:tetratricopeptide repeat protein [Pyrinomonadaceae bacterium]